MQTAGNLVRDVIEFSAGVQHGHDDFGGGAAFFEMDVYRDAATIVRYRYGFIGMDRDHDPIAMAGQRFVDGVVDDLEYHVMQTAAVIGIADVHARPLAHRVEAL